MDELVDADRQAHDAVASSMDELLAELTRMIEAMERRRLEAGHGAETAVVAAPIQPATSGEPPRAAPSPALPAAELASAMASEGSEDAGAFGATVAVKLELLRNLLHEREPCLEPQLDPLSRIGHSCAELDARLGLPPGESLPLLEDLADLGLLQRELINRVHTCPHCHKCQINFREECPGCDSIDHLVEPLVHHFRCGYAGLESEFTQDFELVCPKCRKVLFQLGQDFDRPHETFVCRVCNYFFEEPILNAQCLSCARTFHASEAREARVYRYRPTPLTVRAVELGRLTGLEVDSILYDAQLQIATRDFLDFEVKRELVRLARHTTEFSTAIVHFEHHGRPFPIFREWPASTIRELCVLLAQSLRTLDLVTRLDSSRIGLLMPEAAEDGAVAVRNRLVTILAGLSFTDRSGNELVPSWTARTWSDTMTTFEHVEAFFDGAGKP